MAFEGLLTKLGPSLVRELSPHLLQLTGSFLERFRKDTSAMKASVDAEMSAMRQAHASLAESVAHNASALASLQQQLDRIEEKLDSFQGSQDALVRQISVIEEQIRLTSKSPAGLLWAILAFVLLTLGAVISFFVLHR